MKLSIGNGGHVVFQASHSVNNLSHIKTLLKADDGNDGRSKDRHGKSGEHRIIPVPVGTIVRRTNGKIIGDLDKEGSMFIAARGGAGKIRYDKINPSRMVKIYKNKCLNSF